MSLENVGFTEISRFPDRIASGVIGSIFAAMAIFYFQEGSSGFYYCSVGTIASCYNMAFPSHLAKGTKHLFGFLVRRS